jgi:cellulose biosynthesis protein BcsQ
MLDCSPGLGPLTESVLLACDALILPVIPTVLSLNAHTQLEQFRARKQLTRPLSLPFYSMVDSRHAMHKNLIAQPPGSLGGILTTQIPYSAAVERMGAERMPISLYAPSSPAALAYRALWNEIRGRLI